MSGTFTRDILVMRYQAERCKLPVIAGTREVTLKTGSYFFSEGIAWHEAVNIGDTTVSYLMVEPK